MHVIHVYACMQVSSCVYFMMILPVLRYGPNKLRFPYQDPADSNDAETAATAVYPDAILDPSRGFLSNEGFNAAMSFACAPHPRTHFSTTSMHA